MKEAFTKNNNEVVFGTSPPSISVMDGILPLAWRTTPTLSEKLPAETSVHFNSSDLNFIITIDSKDPDQSSIHATLEAPDQFATDSDWVRVYIDPVGNNRFAQVFGLDAAGSISDGLFFENRLDAGPDFVWSGSVTRAPFGWSGKFIIPWSTLRIGNRDNPHLRIYIERGRPRGDDTRMASVAFNPKEGGCLLCNTLPLKDVPLSSKVVALNIAPGATVTSTKAPGSTSHRDIRTSLDAQWRPDPQWTIDATLNPDFADRDVDDPILSSNARFAISVDEKRRFFLERTDIIDVAGSNWMYTRSISDPQWGVRAIHGGDVDGLTMLVKDRGGDRLLIPGAFGSSSVLRPKSEIFLSRLRFGPTNFQFGVTLVRRQYDVGSNTLLGFDVTAHPREGMLIEAALAESSTTSPGNAGESVLFSTAPAQGNDLKLKFEQRWEGDGVYANARRTSDGFRSDAGFIYQSGVSKLGIGGYHSLGRLSEIIDKVLLEISANGTRTHQGQLQLSEVDWIVYGYTPFGVCKVSVNPGAKVRADYLFPLWRNDRTTIGCTVTPASSVSQIDSSIWIGHKPDYIHKLPGKGHGIDLSATLKPLSAWTIRSSLSYENVVGQSNFGGHDSKVSDIASQVIINYQVAPLTRIRFVKNWNRTSLIDGSMLTDENFPNATGGSASSILFSHSPRLGATWSFGVTTDFQQINPGSIKERTTEMFAKTAWIF